MDNIPIHILEEPSIVKAMNNNHIYSVSDLYEYMKLNDQTIPIIQSSSHTSHNSKVIIDKIHMIRDAVLEGLDHSPESHPTAHNANNNGVSMIVGKRGTGKTTLAVMEMVEKYLAAHKPAIEKYLDGVIGEAEILKLLSNRIMHIECKSIEGAQNIISIIRDKYAWLKDSSGKEIKEKASLSSDGGRQDRYMILMKTVFNMIYLKSVDDLKLILKDILHSEGDERNVKIFGIIVDDLSHLFNKVDHMALKSDSRSVMRSLAMLGSIHGVRVCLVDSVKQQYEDVAPNEVKLHLHPLVFSVVSDIMYVSVNSNMMYVCDVVKCSYVM